jgi:hypothetical protein
MPMGTEVRFFYSKPHNVLIMRFMGNLLGEAIFQPYQKYVQANPALMNAAQIWDARPWSGMVFDDELAAQMAWNQAFRQRHGLSTGYLPPIIFLTHAFSGAETVAHQFQGFRNQPVPVAFDPNTAWAKLVPNVPLPDDARRFLARR